METCIVEGLELVVPAMQIVEIPRDGPRTDDNRQKEGREKEDQGNPQIQMIILSTRVLGVVSVYYVREFLHYPLK